ncbi:TetR family transcriptional regulator [Streptomyces sp. NPDC057837]|uniref:TetR family transcriptional regulator n=1 Tax=Streptomyces sp. NPDC057837 TaxID=3346260 RepID=UPI00369C6DFC
MTINTTGPAMDVNGRIVGERALATRQRLADALAYFLSSQPFRDITVIDIARRAGTSPATFYQYFSSIEDALLLVAHHVVQESGQLAPDTVAAEGCGGLTAARQLIDRLFDFWQAHQAVIRTIDAKAAEGDVRFVEVRNHLLSTAGTPLDRAMERQGAPAGSTVRPKVLTGALVTLLTSAATHESGFAAWGTQDELRDCLASLLVNSIQAA